MVAMQPIVDAVGIALQNPLVIEAACVPCDAAYCKTRRHGRCRPLDHRGIPSSDVRHLDLGPVAAYRSCTDDSRSEHPVPPVPADVLKSRLGSVPLVCRRHEVGRMRRKVWARSRPARRESLEQHTQEESNSLALAARGVLAAPRLPPHIPRRGGRRFFRPSDALRRSVASSLPGAALTHARRSARLGFPGRAPFRLPILSPCVGARCRHPTSTLVFRADFGFIF
jgi:hypothetical protein